MKQDQSDGSHGRKSKYQEHVRPERVCTVTSRRRLQPWGYQSAGCFADCSVAWGGQLLALDIVFFCLCTREGDWVPSRQCAENRAARVHCYGSWDSERGKRRVKDACVSTEWNCTVVRYRCFEIRFLLLSLIIIRSYGRDQHWELRLAIVGFYLRTYSH